jgi:hypothetical protein
VYVDLRGVVVAVREGVLLGVRVLPRLGAVVDLVGVGTGVGVGVVRDGVDVGVADDVSSLAGATDVIGVSWPVAFGLSVWRTTNHPTPPSRTRADNDAMSGPATPLPADRL